MLEALGLSTVNESVYRAMLTHPALDVAGLAAHLDLDPAQVHAALDVLADLALVRLDDTGGTARAVRPQTGLAALLAKVEADIAVRQQQIEAVRAAIADIAVTHEQHEVVLRLEGIDAVRDRLAELARTATTECLSFSPGGAQPADTLHAEAPLNAAALERGVRIRNVYQDSFRNDPATLAHARRMATLGSESRTVPTLPMRLIIVDRSIALTPIDPREPRLGALELRSPGLVAGLLALFDQVWQQGSPFGEVPGARAGEPTPQEKALLHLFADGHTDESAARQLGISARSVQRLMNALTERLQASSRFQAGVEASRRGWI
ncbi:LuxR C-terminal-related transcriptional regulator [Micromonospora echinaurantiaca]|uniref:helix-turn-helix transcriptional regulator n=1 Tax=Micromonospora echinaurantiaca TaxID=47857 RepID=UPI0037174575